MRITVNLERITKISSLILCIIAIITLVIAVNNYLKFVQSVELTAKNIELTHKPVVFIKETISPQNEADRKNPFNHRFVLTNTGKLPARDVKITASILYMISSEISVQQTQDIQLLEQATLYPNSELLFWFKNIIIISESGAEIPNKVEATFTILYSGEGLKEEASETMKFIFSEETNDNWEYVGPNVDIFK